LLPIATARADLADLASAVPEDATSILAKLERRTTDSSHDLWDLLPDPFPTLQSLLAYCDGVSAVLTSLEERLASELNSHESVIGPAAVASTVRDLADALDSVVMMGEQ
jgi:adenylosuccinate lyase